jgi:hypothetical protein
MKFMLIFYRIKLQPIYTPGLMHKVLGLFLGINEDYNKTFLGMGELNPKIFSWGISLKDKDKDPKFMFSSTKVGTNYYIKNVFVQEILKFDEDESLVLILLNDLNIDS